MESVKIKGMSCQHCVGSVQKALEAIPGIDNVIVDLEQGSAKYDGSVSKEVIENTIRNIGFEVINE